MKNNHPDYYNNMAAHVTHSQAQKLQQISRHQVRNNIFSAQSQGHIASCSGHSVT